MFFDWVNRQTDLAMASLNGVVILVGVAFFVLASIRGKGRIPSMVIALVAAGLFIWAGISGVFWLRDQAKGTIEAAPLTSVVETVTYASSGPLHIDTEV